MRWAGKLAPLCLVALAGCGTQLGQQPAPTVAGCIPVVLQDAQNIHQLEGGLAAVSAAPVTVLPPPVMMQPPPMVVTPTPTGPVVSPAPPGTVGMPAPPTVAPVGGSGPTVTPNAQHRRRSADIEQMGQASFAWDKWGRPVPVDSER
jgi:hypothetical protein